MVIRLILIVALGFASGRGESLSEYQVKAAFLYNFAKFVEWPNIPGEQVGPITFCVIGKDPFGDALDQATRGKTINGRPLAIRQLTDITATRSCHVLFVNVAQASRFAEIMAAVRVWSVLTVGEADGFLERGGIVNFFMDGRRVRFQISSEAATRAGLRISSKLLQLSAPQSDKRID